MIKNWMKEWLGLDDVEHRLDDLDQRMGDLERQVEGMAHQTDTTLSHFGDFKNRTEEELELMKVQVEDLIQRFESIEIETVNETTEIVIQAKSIKAKSLKRLRNNEGRINKALGVLRAA